MSDSVRVGTRQIYYGWVIVAALSITETVTWGIVYYLSRVPAASLFWTLSASLVLASVLVSLVGWGPRAAE